MSLSSLNRPHLIAGLGVGLHIAFPYVASMNLSYTTLRLVNLITYGMNTIATSMPGRIDGEQQAKEKELGTNKSKVEESESDSAMSMKDLSPTTGKTLFAPSGWAFIIWAPIFAGEMVLVVSQFFVPESSPVARLIQDVSLPFSVAQLFQCLWCASFRTPKYGKKLMFISTAMLSSTAYSLSNAHSAYTTSPNTASSSSSSSSYRSTTLEYCLFFLPITLHFGWTTAASLVNLNGAVLANLKEEGDDSIIATPKVMAGLGYASALAATALGIHVTESRNAPVYAGVIAWALAAVGDGMKKRVEKSKSCKRRKKDDESVAVSGLFGAGLQKHICYAGACICVAASVMTADAMKQSSS
jgi:hypothetical protein